MTMKKKTIKLKYENYPPENWGKDAKKKWVSSDDVTDDKPNLQCDCGGKSFEVCWWDFLYTGGFCKVYCTTCHKSLLLIDDYA